LGAAVATPAAAQSSHPAVRAEIHVVIATRFAMLASLKISIFQSS